tara:strand:+ start:109 stop:612 length:504 start_codon:yes stop_codon:yes gene_type:complete
MTSEMTTETPSSPAQTSQGWSFWPHGLVILIVGFVVGIITLVIIASRNGDDLVSSDYYAKEINYQTQIDRQKRTNMVADTMTLSYDRQSQDLTFQLPAPHRQSIVTNTKARLYRPSDASLDHSLPMTFDDTGTWHHSTADLDPGQWVLDVTWQLGTKDYFARLQLKR